MACWAETLGDCSKEKSGEHYISQGIFDSKSVVVFGMPWCRNEYVKIGLGRAVANILCSKHNSELSKYDDEAKAFSSFLTNNILESPTENGQITINGWYLEKWALKTFLNLGYLRALHREQEQQMLPPKYLVEYLYRDTQIEEGLGLYFITGSLNNETFTPGLNWNVIRNKEKLDQNISEVLGMIFIFNGIRFAISITPERAEDKLAQMGKVGDFDYSNAKIFYRPKNITLASKSAGQKVLTLRW